METERYVELVDVLLSQINEFRALAEREANFAWIDALEDLESAVEGAGLTKRQEDVVRMYYYEDKKQVDVSRELGCGQDVISRHLKAAVKKIATEYKNQEEYE